MPINIFIIFLISLFLISISSQSIYNLYKHPTSSPAKCIDGSPSALYINQGQTDKILIYFQGGGMCYGINLAQTLQNCYNRSKTSLGSSVNYPQQYNLDDYTIMSIDQDINPLYSTWTKIYIPYCDGVLHQGTKQSPIQYKGTQLYLRGRNNTIQTFQYLNKKYNLYSAKKIVLAGTSAGAMAALVWSNHLYNKIINKNQLLVIFDSGQFVSDYINPWTNTTPGIDYYKSIKSLAFVQAQSLLKQCLVNETKQNCDKFAPVFAIQSEYDLFAIKNILLLKCPFKSFPASLQKCNQTQLNIIQDYRNKSKQSWYNLTVNTKNALWAISCVQHGFLYREIFYNSDQYRVPGVSGKTVLEILSGFVMRSGKKINIDQVNWPQNRACNGMNSNYNDKYMRLE